MAIRTKPRPQLHKHIESLIQQAKICDEVLKENQLDPGQPVISNYAQLLVNFFITNNQQTDDVKDNTRTDIVTQFSDLRLQDKREEFLQPYNTKLRPLQIQLMKLQEDLKSQPDNQSLMTNFQQVKEQYGSLKEKKDNIERELEKLSAGAVAFSAFLTPEKNPDAAAALMAGKALEDHQEDKNYTITEQGNGINKTITIHSRIPSIKDVVNVANGTVFINPSCFTLREETKQKIAEVAARAAKAQGWNTVVICMNNYEKNPKELDRYMKALLKEGFPLEKIYVAAHNYDPQNPQTASSKVPITEALYTSGKKRGQRLLSDEKIQSYAGLYKDVNIIEDAKTAVNKQLETGFIAGLPFANLKTLYEGNNDDTEKANILYSLIRQEDEGSLGAAKQLFEGGEPDLQQPVFPELLKQVNSDNDIKSFGLFLKTFPTKEVAERFATLEHSEKICVLKALQPEQQHSWFTRSSRINSHFDACVLKLIPVPNIGHEDISTVTNLFKALDKNQQDQALKVATQKNPDFALQLNTSLNQSQVPEPASAVDFQRML